MGTAFLYGQKSNSSGGGGSTTSFSELKLINKENTSYTIENAPTGMYCELLPFTNGDKKINGQMRYGDTGEIVEGVTFSFNTDATYGFIDSQTESEYLKDNIRLYTSRELWNTNASKKAATTCYHYSYSRAYWYEWDLGEKIGVPLFVYWSNTYCTCEIFHKDNESDAWISLASSTAGSGNSTMSKYIVTTKRYLKVSLKHTSSKQNKSIYCYLGGLHHNRVCEQYTNHYQLNGNIVEGDIIYCKTGIVDNTQVASNTINNYPINFLLESNKEYILQCVNGSLTIYSEPGIVKTFSKKPDIPEHYLCDGTCVPTTKNNPACTNMTTVRGNEMLKLLPDYSYSQVTKYYHMFRTQLIASDNTIDRYNVDLVKKTMTLNWLLPPGFIKKFFIYNDIDMSIIADTLYSSTDGGATWNVKFAGCNDCVWWKDKYVLTANDGKVYYTTDFETFTLGTLPATLSSSSSIVYNSATIAFLGTPSGSSNSYWYVSSNGIDWTQGITHNSSSSGISYGTVVAFAGGFYQGYYIDGSKKDYTRLYYSPDLKTAWAQKYEWTGYLYSSLMTDGSYLYLGNFGSIGTVFQCWNTNMTTVTPPIAQLTRKATIVGQSNICVTDDIVIFGANYSGSDYGVQFYFPDTSEYTNVKLPMLNDTTNKLYGYIKV